MKVSKYKPHILLLPEDDANRQLANGFCLSLPESANIRVLDPSGGWINVLDDFEKDHIRSMQNNSFRNIVLLIDFDNHLERLVFAQSRIPTDIADRVFILGALDEPEVLKRSLSKSYETIGYEIAQDCSKDANNVWAHPQLRHNANELERLRVHIRPILFPTN